MSRLKVIISCVLFENKKTCTNPKIDQYSALRSDQARSSAIESENSGRLFFFFSLHYTHLFGSVVDHFLT